MSADATTSAGCRQMASTEEKAVKYDQDKLPMELLPPELLEATARALKYGAEKYSRRNWEKGLDPERLFGALQRHLWAYHKGERVDPESGLSHLDHAAASLAMLIATIERTSVQDERARARVGLPGFSKALDAAMKDAEENQPEWHDKWRND